MVSIANIKKDRKETKNDSEAQKYYEGISERHALAAQNHTEKSSYYESLANGEDGDLAQLATYHAQLAEYSNSIAEHAANIADYYEKTSGVYAVKSDNSEKMAAYYEGVARGAVARTQEAALRVENYDAMAREKASYIAETARRLDSAAYIADIATLSVRDSSEQARTVAIATASSEALGGSVTELLDGKGLKTYVVRNERLSDKLSREASGLESKIKKAEGNDRVVLLLDTVVACKKRFDVLADMLKQCCRTRNSKYISRYKKKLVECIRQYNSLTDEYLAISGKQLTKIPESVAADIIAGREYSPIPDITYNRRFARPGGENVVNLIPGVVVENAVSSETFSDMNKLVDKINNQILVSEAAIKKYYFFRISAIERDENIKRYYFDDMAGADKKRCKGRAESERNRKAIARLRAELRKALAEERRLNDDYYSVVYTNPMAVKLPVGAVREDVILARRRIVALLNERHRINADLVAICSGSSVDPNALPTSEKYQNVRMKGARASKRRLQGKRKLLRQLNLVEAGEKQRITDIMNDKIAAESNLKLFIYRLQKEKHNRKGRKLLLRDIKRTNHAIKSLDRELKYMLKRAVMKQRSRRIARADIVLDVLLAVIILCAIGLCVYFRAPIAEFFRSIFRR